MATKQCPECDVELGSTETKCPKCNFDFEELSEETLERIEHANRVLAKRRKAKEDQEEAERRAKQPKKKNFWDSLKGRS